MGTTRRFNRTPDDRKRLTLEIAMPDGNEVRFTFKTRITTAVAKRLDEIMGGGNLDDLAVFLKGLLVSTGTENEPAADFDAADFDIPEMRDLLKEITANGGLEMGESGPSSTPSSDDEGNSSSTSSPSTDSTSTTSANELTASGSFT